MNNQNRVTNNISIENAHIMWRNFAGNPSQYNAQGKRNFCVQLDEDLARELERDGWAVKWREARDPQDTPFAYLQVSVSFDVIPPNIYTVTSRNKTRLTSETVDILDWADISNVDLIIRPYNWEVNGKHGVKAYVKAMYVTLDEDEFADKYSDLYDSNED